MSVIRMQSVDKSYGDIRVLDGLDLEIGAGEVFALLGPNGAGKTTAVEILEGYRRADAGSVEVLGVDPAEAGSELRSRIGIVLQHTTAFENTTVAESVEMFAALFPNSLPVAEAMALVDLGDQADQLAGDLSGGQRRRLDVACGLVGRPELLFLDEPTTGLDPEARRAMWSTIASLRDGGTTVLLTTHYLDEAEALADRIGILLGGRLAEVSEPDRVGRRDRGRARVRFVAPPGADADLAGWGRDGDSVWIETSSPGRVVAELIDRHGELEGLTISRPTLEDAYLEMVARTEVGA